MFKIANETTFTATVKVKTPVGHEKYDEQEFTGEFIIVPVDAWQQVIATQGDAGAAKAVLIGVEGIADEKGEPLPDSGELRDSLCNIPYVRDAIINTYLVWSGGQGAAEKNG